MKNLKQSILTIFIILIMPSFVFAANNEYRAGRDYKVIYTKIPKPVSRKTKYYISQLDDKPGKVVVVEFFSFACPACAALEPTLEKWMKTKPDNVEFKRIPVTYNRNSQILSKAYYMAKTLKVSEKLMPAIFNAIQKQGKMINSEGALKKLFMKNGVSARDFDRAFNAGPTQAAQMLRGMGLVQTYQVYEIPTLVIDGKYKIDPGMTNGDPNKLMEILDFLIRKMQKEKGLRQSSTPGSATTNQQP